MHINYRFADPHDAPLLGRLNKQLIDDEGHRNPMTAEELANRMAAWLSGEYQAVLFQEEAQTVGYALFRREAEHIYLRQLFVCTEHRRRGIARQAMQWLGEHVWPDAPRVRVEVLVVNAPALAFWRSIGFHDYCLTLESRRESHEDGKEG